MPFKISKLLKSIALGNIFIKAKIKQANKIQKLPLFNDSPDNDEKFILLGFKFNFKMQSIEKIANKQKDNINADFIQSKLFSKNRSEYVIIPKYTQEALAKYFIKFLVLKAFIAHVNIEIDINTNIIIEKISEFKLIPSKNLDKTTNPKKGNSAKSKIE